MTHFNSRDHSYYFDCLVSRVGIQTFSDTDCTDGLVYVMYSVPCTGIDNQALAQFLTQVNASGIRLPQAHTLCSLPQQLQPPSPRESHVQHQREHSLPQRGQTGGQSLPQLQPAQPMQSAMENTAESQSVTSPKANHMDMDDKVACKKRTRAQSTDFDPLCDDAPTETSANSSDIRQNTCRTAMAATGRRLLLKDASQANDAESSQDVEMEQLLNDSKNPPRDTDGAAKVSVPMPSQQYPNINGRVVPHFVQPVFGPLPPLSQAANQCAEKVTSAPNAAHVGSSTPTTASAPAPAAQRLSASSSRQACGLALLSQAATTTHSSGGAAPALAKLSTAPCNGTTPSSCSSFVLPPLATAPSTLSTAMSSVQGSNTTASNEGVFGDPSFGMMLPPLEGYNRSPPVQNTHLPDPTLELRGPLASPQKLVVHQSNGNQGDEVTPLKSQNSQVVLQELSLNHKKRKTNQQKLA